MPENLAAEVSKERRLRQYVRKEEIFFQGDPNGGLYCLRSGVVSLSVVDTFGNLIPVGVLMPGEIFGYRSLIGDEPHAVTATAYSPTEVCHVPRRTAVTLIEKHGKTREALSRRLAHDVRRANECYLRSNTLQVRERLIQFLFALGKAAGVEEFAGRVTVPVPMRRSDIAAVLGVVPETMSRATRRLEKDGILVFNKDQVVFSERSWAEAELFEEEYACSF